ncbi:MAG: bifunctional hydroxymethylpyrimidine kinase/phosphomethylpyrimidine kinase [Deltaproteobacteria bacterium]|nr:bifunctional hydroxymethylpyrimidine kinase/phosphomethylpyrimidine kinase [Deltaproteobacteria bacterium]
MNRILTIAGSDSGGGAGIQADIKTASSLGCYSTSAITALTAQNTRGVYDVFPVSPQFVVEQIERILDDIGTDAIKIGMLHSAEIIEAVARCLRRFEGIPIVLDPVMVSQSGNPLLESDAVWALREYLFPQCTLITPNLHEARELVGDRSPEESAKLILSMGPKAVLLKGGHGNPSTHPQATDYLVEEHRSAYFSAPWIETKNTHGTGCTLSAAIAVYLAQDYELFEAVSHGKKYLNQALQKGSKMEIGQGSGPLCHHWRILCES